MALTNSKIHIQKKRRMNQQSGRAIEILAHAIEYLADMHADEGSLLVWEKGHFEALEILKARNREIYEECSVVPDLDERISAFLFGKRA